MKRSKPTGGKYKLTLSLDPDFARRFDAFCGFKGEDMSDVAERALRREMRGFSVSLRVDSADQTETVESGPVRLARPMAEREAS